MWRFGNFDGPRILNVRSHLAHTTIDFGPSFSYALLLAYPVELEVLHDIENNGSRPVFHALLRPRQIVR